MEMSRPRVGPSRLALSLRNLFAVVGVLALAVCGVESASAQGSMNVPLVSNIGQTAGNDHADTYTRFQEFTTGSNLGGYRFTEIDIVSADPEGDRFSVDVYNVSHGGSLIGSMNPISGFAAGTVTFRAEGNLDLQPNRTYEFWAKPSGSTNILTLGTTASDGEDAGGASGWSIDNAVYSYMPVPDYYDHLASGESLRFAIRGIVQPLPTDVTLSVSPGSVSEGASGTVVTVTARLDGDTRGEAVPVAVTVGSGTATSGTDFAAVAGFTITIAPNTQSNTAASR